MLKDILPDDIYSALTMKNCEGDICEIRLRANKPIVVICNTKSYFLGENGLGVGINQAIYASYNMISDIIFRASDYSIYSINDQIKQGYIMVEGGIRVGICGEVVVDGGIKCIKNFTSLCIRLPHTIKNVSLPIFNQIFNGGQINNTLIISPPGAGKTTMIRDIVYQFSCHSYPFNIFIADERGEITGGKDFFNLGNFYDSISFLNKRESMLLGLRSMSPDIIVTDELGGYEDYQALEYMMNCGVKIIATLHGGSIEDIKCKKEIQNLLEKKCFKRFIVLAKDGEKRSIEGVYKENFSRVYGGIM